MFLPAFHQAEICFVEMLMRWDKLPERETETYFFFKLPHFGSWFLSAVTFLSNLFKVQLNLSPAHKLVDFDILHQIMWNVEFKYVF